MSIFVELAPVVSVTTLGVGGRYFVRVGQVGILDFQVRVGGELGVSAVASVIEANPCGDRRDRLAGAW